MPERLRDDLTGVSIPFAQAGERLSDERGIKLPAMVIEMDFWVAETLRTATRKHCGVPRRSQGSQDLHMRPVPEGRTNLSKACGPIARFSEDADV
jgi:hypothetical protein